MKVGLMSVLIPNVKNVHSLVRAVLMDKLVIPVKYPFLREFFQNFVNVPTDIMMITPIHNVNCVSVLVIIVPVLVSV
jgi:hypothetical protein